MSSLTTRVVSSLFALAILFLITYFFKISGMIVMCLVIAAGGIYEMSLLLFKDGFPRFAKTSFFIFGFLNLVLPVYDFVLMSQLGLVLSFIAVIVLSIIFHKRFSSVDSVLIFISKFIMGLIYAAVLPALIIFVLKAQNGVLWFIALLAIVFSGDTGAFVFGSLFGKTKIAPLLSPKKSLQGSLGGLLFSSLAGFVFSIIIPDVSALLMIALGFMGGLLGQTGDFFESLIKRIAGVKDSGSVMPGHGGVLDRIDGVYLASPLFYIAVYYIIK